jgi:hypothetical protein
MFDVLDSLCLFQYKLCSLSGYSMEEHVVVKSVETVILI